MKRIFVLLLAICMFFAFTAGAFAFDVRLDGLDNGIEWESSQGMTLISGESHSNIDFAFVEYYVDDAKNDILMCVMIRDKVMSNQGKNVRLILYADGEELTFAPSEHHGIIQSDRFYFEAYATFDEFKGITVEIRLGVKNGIPAEYPLTLKFRDSDGVLSDACRFTVINPQAQTEQVQQPVIFTAAPKTTRVPKTVKKRTTVSQNTKITTVKQTKAVKTTEPPKTVKVKTTKPKRTVAQKSVKPKTEKAFTEAVSSVETALPSENAVSVTESAAIPEKLSVGDKYKTTVIAAGLTALIMIASISAISAKNKK